ncbi:hypothetical protein C8R44DRAFT_848443 [Mycena epipterygia]|nr:hypothetical protein C8R44DRAFT_848443 [Mycena epipterygia]
MVVKVVRKLRSRRSTELVARIRWELALNRQEASMEIICDQIVVSIWFLSIYGFSFSSTTSMTKVLQEVIHAVTEISWCNGMTSCALNMFGTVTRGLRSGHGALTGV